MAKEVAVKLLGRYKGFERGFCYVGENFTVQEFIFDGLSVKVIDADKPLMARSQLSTILRLFYEAERTLSQPKPARRLTAYKPTRAFTCRHSAAIPFRGDYLCSKCLADGHLAETIWCNLRQREVCSKCHCENCPFYEHWRDRA